MDVTPTAFKAIQTLDVEAIGQLSADEIRPLLPCLVRHALCPSVDNSQEWADKRKTILAIISQNEEVNSIISLLSVDFHAMEIDVKKELEQKTSLSASLTDISRPGLNDNHQGLISSIVNNLSLDFERSDGFCRLRLIISELFAIQAYATELRSKQTTDCLYNSELFDHDVYINELSDILCIALAELPATLQLQQIVETLLYVRSGPRLIQRIAANFSEHFESICLGLLEHGDGNEHDESLLGSVRTGILRSLCRMNPPFAYYLRAAAIKLGRLPALCIHLTLDNMQLFAGRGDNHEARYISDLVFVRGILLGEQGRNVSGMQSTQNGSSGLNTNGSDDQSVLWPLDGPLRSAWAPSGDALDLHEPVRGELHEPVYTLVYQVYDRLDRLLGSLDDRQRDGNKELLLLFANVFTMFNSTISEKIKLQQELDDQRDKCSQLSFRLTKEKEHGAQLREKLEEYESQTHEEIQKYEKDIETLEQKIRQLDKERRRQQFEQEDTHRELKHLIDGLGRLFELLQEYGGSECGAALFFQLFRSQFEECESVDSRDRLKMLSQLNVLLERRFVDVKQSEYRLQEQKILNKMHQNAQKINQILENSGSMFRGLDGSDIAAKSGVDHLQMLDGSELAENGECSCTRLASQGCGNLHCIFDGIDNSDASSWYPVNSGGNTQPFALEDTIDSLGKRRNSYKDGHKFILSNLTTSQDEHAERLRQLKELNQTNLSFLLQYEQAIKEKGALHDDLLTRLADENKRIELDAESEKDESADEVKDESRDHIISTLEKLSEKSDSDEFDEGIYEELLDQYVQCVAGQQLNEAQYRLTEMLSQGLVQVNDNNEIVSTTMPDSKLSQAKLMLIDDKLNQSAQDIAVEDFHEDIHHRFEQSFTEIIRASVSSPDQSPDQGETLKSILSEDSLEWKPDGDSISALYSGHEADQSTTDRKSTTAGGKSSTGDSSFCSSILIEGDNCTRLKSITEARVAQSRQELSEIDGQINEILYDINKLGVLGCKSEEKIIRAGYRDCAVSTAGLISRHDTGTCTERAKRRENFTFAMKISQRHTSTNTITKFHRDASTITDETLLTAAVEQQSSKHNDDDDDGNQKLVHDFAAQTNEADSTNCEVSSSTLVDTLPVSAAADAAASIFSEEGVSIILNGRPAVDVQQQQEKHTAVQLTDVYWQVPSISFLFTTLVYVFYFIKHLAMGVIFLLCSFVFLAQLLFSTTRMPPFHSWEEIVVKLLDPYMTKEHIF